MNDIDKYRINNIRQEDANLCMAKVYSADDEKIMEAVFLTCKALRPDLNAAAFTLDHWEAIRTEILRNIGDA